jgi:hypothetical protein
MRLRRRDLLKAGLAAGRMVKKLTRPFVRRI